MTTMPASPGPSDALLMRRVAQGDVSAFSELYNRHEAGAYRLALRLTRRVSNAEEVIQDVFLGLWRNAGNYDADRGPLRPWLLAMVRFRAIDSLRRNGRQDREVELDESAVGNLQAPELTEDLVLMRDEARQVRGLVAALPERQREVIELHYFRGLTQSEIASRTGAPLGTVKGRARLALRRLGSAAVAA